MTAFLSLEKAAAELMDYARATAYDPRTMRPPPLEAYRTIEREGVVFKLLLSRLVSDDFGAPRLRDIYLLSIQKTAAASDEPQDRSLPTDEEGAEIARAFFPRGCTALGYYPETTCSKYVALIGAD